MKINKKSILILAMSGLIAGGMTSCKKEGCTDETADNFDEKADEDDGSCEYSVSSTSGELTENTTWDANRIWELDGKVIVPDGITLTIEPGTIIKGKEGQEASASALIVARGGKLIAEGTADEPIIFTSILDNIEVGQKVGSNLDKTTNELWGGIAILGYAKVSTENGDTEGNLEGIPANEGYGKYGGTNNADNSGSLKYVSIRHGGISIGEGNELNGLTLAGVGNGTTIENIEVYATLDDGMECFGGSVNVSNILVYYQGDDGIDLDQNYSGTISNFAVIHGDGIGTDEGLEIDGPEGSTYTDGMFTLTKGLCRTEGTEDASASDFKSGAQGNVMNVTFEYGSKPIKFRTKFTTYDGANSDCTHKSDAYQNLVDGKLNFTGSKFSAVKVYDGGLEDGDAAVCETVLDDANTTAASKAVSGSGGSVNLSDWSWGAAGTNGEL